MRQIHRGCHLVGAIAVIALALSYTPLLALNISTHHIINESAADASTLGAFLKEHLGMRDGLQTTFKSNRVRSAREWLAEGGEREDDGTVLNGRFYNHFLDPLKSWSVAGLQIFGYNPSSISWMQTSNQFPGGHWSWSDARRFYLAALTSADARTREESMADLFRGLGQIMHLVVDASVPEHTRNDAHPMGTVAREFLNRRKAGNYEYWVSDQQLDDKGKPSTSAEDAFKARFLANPIGFDPAILKIPSPLGEAVARVPIARLLDADMYDADPNVTLAGPVGLAEFSNANFFSEDTLDGSFPFPRRDLLTPSRKPAPKGTNVRRYFAKPQGQGIPLNVALAECVPETTTGTWIAGRRPPYPCVDEAVWEETAKYMLPRAVGYARGVLDYFFRGSLAVTRVTWNSGGVVVSIRNTGDEVMTGTFDIYARHEPGTSQEQRVRFTTLGDGDPITLDPGEDWSGFIDVPEDAIATPSFVLVFKGRLGLEDDAVVGQVFTVPHVEVRETTYDADVAPSCATLPTFSAKTPYPLGATLKILSDAKSCIWRVNGHRVAGVIQTNMPIDPVTHRREPVIDRIEAAWVGGGATGGPAPLVLDGHDVDSVWQRQASEPDPQTFEIVDGTYRGQSYLFLWVAYRDGHEVEVHLATFTDATANHGKSIWLDNTNPNTPRYLVSSGRGVTDLVAYNYGITGQPRRPLFQAISIGGAPVPTNARSYKTFGAIGLGEGLYVDEESYNASVTDTFAVFTSRAPADTLYSSIELLGPHPQGPFFSWTAEIRRSYQQGEREFLRAFVANAPEPFVIELSGQEAD